MSDFTQVIDCEVPAGNGSQVFTTFPAPLGLSEVSEVTLVFPPGCAGLVGVALYLGGSPVYPNQSGQYFTFDDYIYDQTVTNQVNSGQWAIVAYNEDYVPHNIEVIFQADYVVYSPEIGSAPPLSL